jgi:hypothetical protein
MPYPESHLLLTIHWIHEAYPLESGQIGLRFHVTGAGNLDASQTRVDACAQSVKSFWNTVGAKIPLNYLIKYLRLARIGEDGSYVPGTSSFDSVYAATGSAGAGGQNSAPLQTACVTTLLAAVPHGQASHGRVYLPPIAATPSNAGLWTAADADNRSNAVATMLTSLNTVLNGTAAIYSKGTLRNQAGLGRKVVEVTTGTRPDVQRRRAKGVPDVKGAHSGVVSAADPGQVLEGWI